jgi:hypothetical protein
VGIYQHGLIYSYKTDVLKDLALGGDPKQPFNLNAGAARQCVRPNSKTGMPASFTKYFYHQI